MSNDYEAIKEYRKNKIKRIPLDIPMPLYEKLKAKADASGDKINSILRRAIENYVAGNITTDKNSTLEIFTQYISENKKTPVPASTFTYRKIPDDYEPQQWEKTIPRKYWGFDSRKDLFNYIKNNNLEEEFDEDTAAMYE